LDLHRGSYGWKVRVLENRLHELQLLRASAVDRRYRLPTVYAVKRFQRSHGLRVTGRTNQRTWDAVYRAVLRRRAATAPVPRPPPPPPTILGHQGAVVPSVPSNTMASMRYAVRSVDILEFDLRLTADRAFVLMHDPTLDRTTNCTGPVEVKTLQELRSQCTASGEPIPTLDEVAAFAAATAASIAPELKVESLSDEDLSRFAGVIRAHGLTGRTFVQSFHPSLFPRLRAQDGALALVYLTRPTTAPQTVKSAGVTIAGLYKGGLTAAIVATYQRAGLKVWAWTSYTTTEFKSLWNMRVNGIFTDIPVESRALLSAS